MTKQENYMEYLKNCFQEHLTDNYKILNAYGYSDRRAIDCIKDFKDEVESIGLNFSTCYHANGIGNNNEYVIYFEGKDEDGFIIEKKVAKFYYCTGIYGGVYTYLEDLANDNKMVVGHAT